MLLSIALASFLSFVVLIIYEKYREWSCLRQMAAHGYSLPKVDRSFPLGLPRTLKALKHLRDDSFFEFMRNTEFHTRKTYYFREIGKHIISTNKPENIKAILATQFGEYEFGPIRHRQLYPFLGNGIFTLSGKGWSHSRALLRPMFTKQSIISKLDHLEHNTQVLINILSNSSTEKRAVDIQELFFKLTMDIGTELLFGESCDSLSSSITSLNKEGVKATDELTEAWNKAEAYTTMRFMIPVVFDLVDTKESRRCNNLCKSFVENYVKQALENRDKYNQSGQYNLVGELANVTDDIATIRDQCLNILLAARGTAAGFLSFAIAILSKNIEVWKKLQTIVRDTFGSGKEDLTFESLKRCEYLRHVMNEILRLYPVVPLNGRVALQNTTLPVGGGPDESEPLYVQKDTLILYNAYTIHRDTSLWGSDANKFRPERWKTSRQHPWAYIPFNGGPRICIGQQLALTSAAYVLVRLLQSFDNIHSTRDFDTEDIPMKMRLSASVSGGVPVWFDRAGPS